MMPIYSHPCFFDIQHNIINFQRYKDIHYDLSQIEIQLVNTILPEKKRFSETQRFITFKYEGLLNDKTALIEEFNKKYPKESLSKPELLVFTHYINENIKYGERILNLCYALLNYIYRESFSPQSEIEKVLNTFPYKDKDNEVYTKIKDFFKLNKNKKKGTKLKNLN